jgi:hypothetical protein
MKPIYSSLIVVLLFSLTASGQGFYADPVNPGRVYRELKWDNIVGTVLLFEDWHPARVKITQGKIITGILVNFDVYSHKALYQNKNEPFEFIDQLDYIETDFDNSKERKIFMNGFISNQFSPTTFVQVLNEGRLRLIKYVRKILVDNKSYGSGSNDNKSIELQSFYFIADNTAAKPVKLSKSALEELAGNKKADLFSFISSNQLNIKNEVDFGKALAHLNELQ